MRLIDADKLIEHITNTADLGGWIGEALQQIKQVAIKYIDSAPTIEIIRCGECKHCSKDRIKWSVKGEDGNWIDTKCNLCRRTKLEVKPDDFCSYGERRDSEKPNNCEHITEDGVTCAKYPACDDCPDNPLNKVKGSERLVKGSEKPNNSKERSSE